MPTVYAYLLKWGPGSGCSASPFTRTTFHPAHSVLANLLGGRSAGQPPVVLWAATVSTDSLSHKDGQAWDTIIVVEYPEGCPADPEAFAKHVAQDRLCLKLQSESSIPGMRAGTSKM